MKLSPYTKHDDELVELLTECVDDLHAEVQQPYLINLLTLPSNKNLTIKEVLSKEVKAKRELEKEVEERVTEE